MTNYSIKIYRNRNEHRQRSYLDDKGQDKVQSRWLSSFSSWTMKNYHHHI